MSACAPGTPRGPPSDLCLSVVTVLEVEVGIEPLDVAVVDPWSGAVGPGASEL